MRLHHILGQPWAVSADLAIAVRDLLERDGFSALRAGARIHGLTDAPQAAARSEKRSAGSIALLQVLGPMTQRGDEIDSQETVSTERLAASVTAAASNPEVEALVLEWDSPGGEVFGAPEAARAIRDARKVKPVVSVANSMAASLGYWLASQADELLVTPSGQVGSVGVYSGHLDVSKELEGRGRKVTLVSAGRYKVEGNPYEPLGDQARVAMQADVDRYYGMFVADVARGRGVKVDAVLGGFGEGRMVGAQAAVDARMADGVGTVDDAIARARVLARERRARSSSVAMAQADAFRRARA